MKTLALALVAAMVAFAAVALRRLPHEGRSAPGDPGFTEVAVLGVVHTGPDGFAVLLAEKGAPRPGRGLVIGVGAMEGTSIAMALGEKRFARPLTHDLTVEILRRSGIALVGLTIHSLQHDTYFARLRLASNGSAIDLDCRPSDGIALALRAKAPIRVSPKLLRERRLPAGHPPLDPSPTSARSL